ncbi:MAG TPA: CGNR zinc finger domain-containing protein [Bryobacteraceae bacterium]|nr:CGNR zinc finger domain-containing protein [Bryobacteraceae bacterium]
MAISPDFGFVGRLCLDLTVTGDMGYGIRFERLVNAKELQRWLSIGPLRLANVRVGPADVAATKKLRGAIWRVVGAILAKAAPAPADVHLINRVGREPALMRELLPGAGSMRWRSPTVAAALATIAQDAIVLLGEPTQRARIHRCENPKCRVVFYDDSRPGLRRWCAPNRCGDRIRAKLYRDRHRIEQGTKPEQK